MRGEEGEEREERRGRRGEGGGEREANHRGDHSTSHKATNSVAYSLV